MKVAFDTSVLVPALVAAHPNFDVASAWVDAVEAGEVVGIWTTRAYAETWSVLTRLPLTERIDAGTANAVLESLVGLMAPLPLSVGDYRSASGRAAAADGRSGIIFDALHLVRAERAGADQLLTFNVADFERLDPRIEVVEP